MVAAQSRRGRTSPAARRPSHLTLILEAHVSDTARSSSARVIQPSVTVRSAEPPDAETILVMIKALAASQGVGNRVHATLDHIRRDFFGHGKRIEALIGERGGVPAGLALFQEIYTTWDAEPALMVNDLFVDEAARGLGVGLALMQAIARTAKTRGCASVQLNVIHANRNATFFDQLGFVHQEDLLSYRLDANGLFKMLEMAG